MKNFKQLLRMLLLLLISHPLYSMKHVDQMVARAFSLAKQAPSQTTNLRSITHLSVPGPTWYSSRFTPPHTSALKVLKEGLILGDNEQPHAMVERIVNTVASAEKKYGMSKNLIPTHIFAQKLGTLMDKHAIVFSTPILTNAGRFTHRPLSACVMPPVNLKADFKKIKSMVDTYHQDGMGTGYNLSDEKNPLDILFSLNNIALEGARSKKEQRPVGNMAILNVYHPSIEEFIHAKIEIDKQTNKSIFNISIDVDDNFMRAVKNDTTIELHDGKKVSARNLFQKISRAAHICGDPGIISLQRLNQDNPTPHLGEYKTTAPCAEVGLAPGETCLFGYINLAQCIVRSNGISNFDFDSLKDTVNVMTRALDNMLEVSIDHYLVPESKAIMKAKRKIGIGICGFADMLIKLGYSYEQKESQDLLRDILTFISYHAKQSSVELSMDRGSFSGLPMSRYMDESFIMNKYGKNNTAQVSTEQWLKLAKTIKDTRQLRNASTTALPPTGRSALVIGASTSIEPIFSLHTEDGIYPLLSNYLKDNSLEKNTAVVEEIKKTGRCPQSIQPRNNPFVTATEVSPHNHLAMTIVASQSIDESISKTVNVPSETTPDEIGDIYIKAYDSGLKGISVYRDGSRTQQPKELSQSKNSVKKD